MLDVHRVESVGLCCRGTERHLPWPESGPVPVQVTHTCWTPADGSPVALAEKRT